MSFGRLVFSIEEGLARIVIANEANSNAIDLQVCRELAEAATAIGLDASIKAVLIEARGKAFGVGGDLKELVRNRDRIQAHILEMTTHFHAAIVQLRSVTAPVVIAVNGIAAGGSFSLVCTADMAIAKRSAKFVAAYTRSGLSPDGGGTFFLPRIVGVQRAFDIFATNPTLTADQALELGILSRVVDDDVFEAEVSKLVQTIMESPPGALPALKKLLRGSTSASLEQQLLAESEAIATLAASSATLARLNAFVGGKGN